MLEFYTDGACSGNPGPGGYGCLIFNDAISNIPIHSLAGSAPQTTNNRMELSAVLAAMLYIEQHSINEEVHIYTDSAYICNALNDQWYLKWLTNGWKNSKKEPIANKDLWEKLLSAYLKRLKTIKVYKVKGHSTSIRNNLVDHLAVSMYQKYLTNK